MTIFLGHQTQKLVGDYLNDVRLWMLSCLYYRKFRKRKNPEAHQNLTTPYFLAPPQSFAIFANFSKNHRFQMAIS